MTDHPAEDYTDADAPRVEDLIDETRGPEEDPPEATDVAEELPVTPEPPD
jgi:hypothetical protein